MSGRREMLWVPPLALVLHGAPLIQQTHGGRGGGFGGGARRQPPPPPPETAPLPRIIKPRKRRKKERKQAEPPAPEPPPACTCSSCDPSSDTWTSTWDLRPATAWDVSSEIVTSANGHRDLEIRFILPPPKAPSPAPAASLAEPPPWSSREE